MFKLFALLLSVILLSNCQLPKDPKGTLQRIQRSHILKVGICASTSTKEQTLLENLSRDLKAELVKFISVQDKLFRQLEDNTVNLVVCQIQEDNPWSERVAFSAPILNKEKYVWAVAQGENAWLKYIDGFIYRHREVTN